LSIFVSNHDFVNGTTIRQRPRSCAKSAQKYASPEHAAHKGCQLAAHRRRMAKVITFQFRRSRLPRRLLNDGWWLVSPRVRSSIIAFPKRDKSKAKTKARHLTLVTSGK
jgi:hypothetical protein